MKSVAIALSMLALSVSLRQTQGAKTMVKETETFEAIQTGSMSFNSFTRLNSGLGIFAGSTPETGVEPWITNGSARKTDLLVDIRPGPETSQAQGFTRYWYEAFFYADDGVHGMEVWRTDGTREGTRLLADLVPGPDGMRPIGLTVIDHRLFIPVDSGKGGPLTFHVFTHDLSRSYPDE